MRRRQAAIWSPVEPMRLTCLTKSTGCRQLWRPSQVRCSSHSVEGVMGERHEPHPPAWCAVTPKPGSDG
jgi:hypothetical protein